SASFPESLETIEKPFYSHPGRPKAGEEPQGYYYYPQITLEQSEALIYLTRIKQVGYFSDESS
uniref:hypothetical protein n=1 Tax=Prochlorothrix hollandica TaxID=1223 RepID=UPI001CECADA3